MRPPIFFLSRRKRADTVQGKPKLLLCYLKGNKSHRNLGIPDLKTEVLAMGEQNIAQGQLLTHS
jgi:hypothetical protein